MNVHITRIAIGAGIAARIAWACAGPDALASDAVAYRALARSIASGNGLATSAGPSAHWVPGWPAWMALVMRMNDSDLAIALANAALGCMTIALVFALARELQDESTAWIAAAACALTPSLVLLPRVFLSENLALPLVVAGVYAIVRARRAPSISAWVIVGVVAGVATLVRESCVALFVAGAAFAMRTGPARRSRALVSVTLAFALVVTPWIARNRSVIGVTALSTRANENFCIGLGEGATGGYRVVAPAAPETPEEERARSDAAVQCVREGLARHPLSIISLAPAKLARFAVWDDWIIDDFLPLPTTERGRIFLGALAVLCNITWWSLALLAFVATWRRPAAAREIEAFAACLVALVLVTFATPRFHAPLVPLASVLAAGYRRRS